MAVRLHDCPPVSQFDFVSTKPSSQSRRLLRIQPALRCVATNDRENGDHERRRMVAHSAIVSGESRGGRCLPPTRING